MKEYLASIVGSAVAASLRALPSSNAVRILLARQWESRFRWRRTAILGRTKFGARMRLQPSDSVQGRILTTGVWEPNITRIVLSSLREGDTFVDIGANVGYYSLIASKLVGEKGKVYAIEASPSVHRKLVANALLNDCSNIVAINAAAYSKPGEVRIFLADESNIGHSTTVESLALAEGIRAEASVRADTVQRLILESAFLQARLVKMDIEGAERAAVEGFVALLPKMVDTCEFIVELSPEFSPNGQSDVDWIFQSFSDAGYKCYLVSNSYDDADLASMRSSGEIQLVECDSPPKDRLNDVIFSKFRPVHGR